jgi:hypothetical protein
MLKSIAVLLLALPLVFVGCASEPGEQAVTPSGEVMGGVATVYTAPVTFVECGWSVIPLQEEVANDMTPAPGIGFDYWGHNVNSIFYNTRHAGYQLMNSFLNTNADLPPYDTFETQYRRDHTTIHQTFDYFLMGYDWDNPYVN